MVFVEGFVLRGQTGDCVGVWSCISFRVLLASSQHLFLCLFLHSAGSFAIAFRVPALFPCLICFFHNFHFCVYFCVSTSLSQWVSLFSLPELLLFSTTISLLSTHGYCCYSFLCQTAVVDSLSALEDHAVP